MLKKFWLYLSLTILFSANTAFAQGIDDIDQMNREAIDQETRSALYTDEPEPEPAQDLCDPNNPNSDNCNLFQIENGKAQSPFSNGKKSKKD